MTNILVPLHDQDANDCHKWDCKQRGNKDPERFFLLHSFKKKKKKNHFSHRHSQKGESEEKREALLRLTVRNFFKGSNAPLTPGAVVQSAAHLDRVRISRTDAVQAKVGLFA